MSPHTDRHGTPVQPGDVIEFVHAGEQHTAPVHSLVHDPHGRSVAHVVVPAQVFTAAARVTKKAEPKPEPKPEPKHEAEKHTHHTTKEVKK